MPGNRKAAMKALLDNLGPVDKTGENVKYWVAELNKLDDGQFDKFMVDLKNGEVSLDIVAPNYKKGSYSIKELLEIGERLGHKFFERCWLTDEGTGVTYLTVEKYPIVDMPARRQSQTLRDKMSTASHNKAIDTLSGQVTGDSRSSRLSFVEILTLNSQGCDRTIEELIKPRGGDSKALALLDKQIIETGHGSLDAPGMDTGTVKSVDMGAVILRCAHLENTLDKG